VFGTTPTGFGFPGKLLLLRNSGGQPDALVSNPKRVFRKLATETAWSPLPASADLQNAHSLVEDAAVDGTLHAATSSGMYTMRAGEDAWSPLNGGLTESADNARLVLVSLVQSPSDPARIYVGGEISGVWATQTAGA